MSFARLGVMAKLLMDGFRSGRGWCWLRLGGHDDDGYDDGSGEGAAAHQGTAHQAAAGDNHENTDAAEKLDNRSAKKLAKLNARAAAHDRAHARALHMQLTNSALKAARKEASRGGTDVKRAAEDAWTRALAETDERGRRLLEEYAEAQGKTPKKKVVVEDTAAGAQESAGGGGGALGGVGAALRGVWGRS